MIRGGSGIDTIDGGLGNDLIFGEDGSDIIDGGLDDDAILGGRGNDTITGGGGNDAITGDSGNDTIQGGSGNDFILGGRSNDILRGGPGDDSIDGGIGNDQLFGGPGADIYTPSVGDDFIDLQGNDLFVQPLVVNSTDTPISLTGSSTSSFINITEDFQINDLNLQFSGNVAGLAISLTSPSGTTVELATGRAPLRSYDFTLDDDTFEAFGQILSGTDAVSGTSRPLGGFLRGFDGESPLGTWELTVGTSGTLTGWSLDFNNRDERLRLLSGQQRIGAFVIDTRGRIVGSQSRVSFFTFRTSNDPDDDGF